MIVQQAEHEKWRDVPDWKKNLLQDKEKRKAEELVRYDGAVVSGVGGNLAGVC